MKKKGKKPKIEEEDKKKGQIFTEEDLMDKSIMRTTEYFCFMPQDSIYYVTRSNLLNNEMKFMMRKILGQLNYLLYLDFKKFWSTLLYSASLKKCLQSCLTYFNRKKYNQYVRQDMNFAQIKDNETAQYQSHLFKTVLTIFYRILNGDQQNHDLWLKYKLSQEIYNKWILDMPKLFDLMDVYSSDNKQIVHIMVKKLFALHEDYKQDFIDVLKIISKESLPKIFEQLKAINDREQFEEGATEAQLRKKVKVMMTIKDIMSALTQAYQFFPEDTSIHIIMDFSMLKYIENIYYEMYSGYKFWKLGPYGSKLHPLIDSIILDVVNFWQLTFQKFRQVVVQQIVQQGVSRKQIILILNEVIKNFGTVLSMGVKNRDKKRNFMLLERLIDEADMEQFIDELAQEGPGITGLDVNAVQQINGVIKGIIKLKNKRMGIEEPEPQPEVQEEVVEQKLPQMEDKPVRQPSFKPPVARREPSKVETEEMRQKRREILQRQYDDDYDDFTDYNRRVNDKREDDTDSGDEEQLKPPEKTQPTQQKRQGWRQGRGKGRQQPPKRGQERHFDSYKVIEERNKQPEQAKPKYVEVDRNEKPRNQEPKKKKYREKT